MISIASLFILHPILPQWVGYDINYNVYILLIVFLILILFSPSLERINPKKVEFDLNTAQLIRLVLFSATIEGQVGELKIDREIKRENIRRA